MADKEFMNIALKEAEKALKRGDYPAGCVIVKNGKLIVKSSSSKLTTKDATAHAEINAIRKACKLLNSSFLDGCIVYITVEPCLMCANAIIRARIKKVIYGTEHKEYGTKKSFDILKENKIGTDIKVIEGIKELESKRLVKQFMDSVGVVE